MEFDTPFLQRKHLRRQQLREKLREVQLLRMELLREELRELHSQSVSPLDLFGARLTEEAKYFDGLRIIYTAKNTDEMTLAKALGFRIVYVQYKANPRLTVTEYLLEDRKTGEHVTSYSPRPMSSIVIGRDDEVPLSPVKPRFCAYVVPPDLPIGDVWLDFVIEELVSYVSDRGCERLHSCRASWNGDVFQIRHVEPPNKRFLIG
jgi:hypothetical protein